MAERNYMNSNELFPILDLIHRKVNQSKGVTVGVGEESNEVGSIFDTSTWEVETFEVVRDTENQYDPEVIKQIIIVYRNGAMETIDLHRGLEPPVDKTVGDYIYINHLMITGLTMFIQWGELAQEIEAKIFKENGYGNFQRVVLTYNGELHEEEDFEGEEMDNPNDWYDNVPPAEEEEPEDYIPEDFVDQPLSPGDEPQMPDSGWVNGRPSDPIEVEVETEIEEQP